MDPYLAGVKGAESGVIVPQFLTFELVSLSSTGEKILEPSWTDWRTGLGLPGYSSGLLSSSCAPLERLERVQRLAVESGYVKIKDLA